LDIQVTDPMENDVVIPILGITGAGKSAFINAAAGRDVTTVGHGLNPCTTTIQPVIVPYPGDPTRRIVFVDTPGFNDISDDDVKILRRIVDWLKISCDYGMKIAGIIYLHEISQTRIATVKDNLDLFHNPSVVENVILATTKWDDVTLDVGQLREKEISQQYWTGPYMDRFLGTSDSAWTIVNRVLENNPNNILPIREELVNLLGSIPKTRKSQIPWGFFTFLFKRREPQVST